MEILTNYTIARHVMRLNISNKSVNKQARFKDQSCKDPDDFCRIGGLRDNCVCHEGGGGSFLPVFSVTLTC